ncbi:MAG TPA: 6-phosphogluconolactonase [Verrucomicrobiae bacterium]|nr:6-phosphogluconolactonase [Verrucomicrobiae bacterium]
MQRYEFISFPSDEALAGAVAARWLEELSGAAHNGGYCVAFSGGRIAKRFFAAVAERVEDCADFRGRVHFFWGDERCVPPTDAESNFALARDLLLAPLQVPSDRIHRIRGEIAPERAAAEAEAEVCRIAPLNGLGQPVLDLAFLGVGEDGHVASLFPDTPAEVTDGGAVYVPVVAIKPPPRRISINYPALAAAREVWVLASGAGKEEALRASVSPTGKTPLARVIQLRQKTLIFSDIRMGI